MQLWGLHAIDLALVVDLPRRRAVARQARRRESRDARRLLPGGPETREGLPVLPELRHLDARGPGRRGVARGVSPGDRRDVDPVAGPLPHAVLLVHRDALPPRAAHDGGRLLRRAVPEPFPGGVLRGVHARPVGADRRRHRLSRRGEDRRGDDAEAGRALHPRRTPEHCRIHRTAPDRHASRRLAHPGRTDPGRRTAGEGEARRTALVRVVRGRDLVLPRLRAHRGHLHDAGRLPRGGPDRRDSGHADRRLLGACSSPSACPTSAAWPASTSAFPLTCSSSSGRPR